MRRVSNRIDIASSELNEIVGSVFSQFANPGACPNHDRAATSVTVHDDEANAATRRRDVDIDPGLEDDHQAYRSERRAFHSTIA
jgi:hypothetical protein